MRKERAIQTVSEIFGGVSVSFQLLAWMWALFVTGDAGPDRTFIALIALSAAFAAVSLIAGRRSS